MPRKLATASLIGLVLTGAGCASNAPDDSTVGDYLAGRLAARANDVDAAADAFAAAQGEAPGSTDLLRDAFFYSTAAGEVEAAMPFAAALAKRKYAEDDGLSKIALAARAIKNGRYGEARTLLADGVDAEYLNPTVKILTAWATAAERGPNAAAKVLTDTTRDEFKGFYPLHEALLAEKAGRLADARAAHQVSVMTYGGPVGRSAYGAFLERTGDEVAAREYYAILAEDPGLGRQVARKGLERLKSGEAPTEFADTTPAEGAAIAFYSLGAAILDQTITQRAAAERAGFILNEANYNMPLIFFQLALYLDPDLDEAMRFAGSLYNIYGEYEKAIAALSKIAPASPYYEQARIEIAGALNALDRPGEAEKTLRQAARRTDGGFAARLALAGLMADHGRHSEAVAVLDDLIAALPEEPEEDAWRYYLSRAASLLELDDWERAEADLQRAVKIAPEEATVLNYLGYSWAERGENLDRAFALIEKAVALEPTSGPIIDSLGWAHYQLGHYEEAVGHLEQAAALEPADPTITDHLGDVYWRLGRKIEARYQWRRVLELDPGEELEQRVEQKLARGLPDEEE